MHEIAEKGIAAHWKYKENVKLNDKKIEEWVRSIRDTFETANKEDESSSQLIESFKLNLYQDEIYCFTPKGELKILPYGSTPLDFAFEIHTEVGMRCIGAKVNGKIVTLDTLLKSGSQIEIITSKNSKPKMDWEKFVVTHKAKADIRKYFNTERRDLIQKGREIFDKKIKKNKLHVDEDDFQKVLHKLKFKGSQDFYFELSKDEKKTNEVLKILLDKSKIQALESIDNLTLDNQEINNAGNSAEFDKYVKDARSTGTGILIGSSTDEKEMAGIKYGFANCCNPIPGDDVIGFVTQTEGIKIHRKNCKNIVNLFLVDPQRIVEINWGDSSTGEFTGGIKIIGEDKPGVLNEITKTISKNFKVNIKSLNIFSKGSMFEGTLILAVENLTQLNAIIDKINSQEGIFIAERFNG